METYIWMYIIVGLFGLFLPWLKRFEQIQILNVPIVAILLGMLIFSLPINLPDPDPIKYEKEILKLTEIAVIISLMGAGLKINRDFSFSAYRVPLLLVLVTMIGCIAATAMLGWWFGLVPASALLLGAVFAPTDPVLASDVQVEVEEDADEEHPVQFNLTSEAGLNDGMAFPFTWCAIWVAMYGFNYDDWLSTWLLKDLVYRILGGLLFGYGFGRMIAWLLFILPDKLNIAPKRLGFVAVSATFLIYGVSEAAEVYGFISVFVAALTIRHHEKQNTFNNEMHDVVEQVEQFMITIILLLLGGYIAHHWFQALTFPIIGLCLVFIFIIRPFFGIFPTLSTDMPWKHRWAVAFLGIKGIGSFFYLAFALHETTFPQEDLLWNTVAFLVLISAVVHRIVGFYVKRKIL
ncbi:cation:proton antiporter [Zeaxanthinibacter sp. PT1]|uniref:cation:proton antiporter n=1 Tax=Zeaxanthinibacter TaxID=561554 RepID=UPI0023490B00|nr:cation:proton antiporter [Zeaxanthinibacter sp. PT1]MDC6350090.1 cation:proton antiporter [Zeaxanthinibacter sp. PT1]